MLELILIVLVLCIVLGYVRGGGWPVDPIGILVTVLIIILIVSLFTPYPYRYRVF